jgi:hypothetical protein
VYADYWCSVNVLPVLLELSVLSVSEECVAHLSHIPRQVYPNVQCVSWMKDKNGNVALESLIGMVALTKSPTPAPTSPTPAHPFTNSPTNPTTNMPTYPRTPLRTHTPMHTHARVLTERQAHTHTHTHKHKPEHTHSTTQALAFPSFPAFPNPQRDPQCVQHACVDTTDQ